MSTRSAILIQDQNGSWTIHYCQYDGYPSHMLPALAKTDPSEIIASKELRAIDAAGTCEGFDRPRCALKTDCPTMPEWADHAYVLTANGWQHAANRRALETLTAI